MKKIVLLFCGFTVSCAKFESTCTFTDKEGISRNNGTNRDIDTILETWSSTSSSVNYSRVLISNHNGYDTIVVSHSANMLPKQTCWFKQ
jgi:hypothetical protein